MAHEDVAEMSYEQARGQLEAVVGRLEAGDLPLEELMTLWERGEVLARACEARLAGAAARLEAVRREQEGGGPG